MRTASVVIAAALAAGALTAQPMPEGGFTPVFNQITILLAQSATRPAENTPIEKLGGQSERVLMENTIDPSGIVVPSVFIRGAAKKDASGRSIQDVILAVDSAIGMSKLFGGELTVFVRQPAAQLRRVAPSESMRFFSLRHPGTAAPARLSAGRIESISADAAFPARVTVPVYYTFVTGGADGKVATAQDNKYIRAAEPHVMEATVNNIPPDPNTPIRSRRWTRIDGRGPETRWIFVEAFRFLGKGDLQHKERLRFPG